MLASEMRELTMSAISTDRVIIEVAREIRNSASKGQFNLTAKIRTDIVGTVREHLEERGFVVQTIANSIPEAKTIIDINWE